MSKIKGITIWEQNAEYFVLGAAAALRPTRGS
jgi:hypothetical protein